MKRLILNLFFAAMVTIGCYAAQVPQYLSYIEQWKEEAIRQQQDYAIPAAISMAQGLLESGAGQSELAVEANNHFGIKCTSDWLGGSYRHDDETRDECFRAYLDAAESWKDHSKFLHRSRYAVLFELDINDYQGWANGLKDCGYATDPAYPQKLIRIIEEYRLDTLVSGSAPLAPAETQTNDTVVSKEKEEAQYPLIDKISKEEYIYADGSEEYTHPKSASRERHDFYSTHPRKRMNGVRYVVAREGDTYASIAFSLNMKERTLRKKNDALGRDLQKGDRVYLHYKRYWGLKEHALLWVHPGESLWMISQREGIRLENMRKRNGLPKNIESFKTRQKILIRPIKQVK